MRRPHDVTNVKKKKSGSVEEKTWVQAATETNRLRVRAASDNPKQDAFGIESSPHRRNSGRRRRMSDDGPRNEELVGRGSPSHVMRPEGGELVDPADSILHWKLFWSTKAPTLQSHFRSAASPRHAALAAEAPQGVLARAGYRRPSEVQEGEEKIRQRWRPARRPAQRRARQHSRQLQSLRGQGRPEA